MNTRELIEELRLNADHLEAILQGPAQPLNLHCDFAGAVKQQREAFLGHYCGGKMEWSIFADGRVEVRWSAYDGKHWTGEHQLIADAINDAILRASRPKIDPVKECDKALATPIPF